MASYPGLRASEIALAFEGGAYPQPSRITRTSGLFTIEVLRSAQDFGGGLPLALTPARRLKLIWHAGEIVNHWVNRSGRTRFLEFSYDQRKASRSGSLCDPETRH